MKNICFGILFALLVVGGLASPGGYCFPTGVKNNLAKAGIPDKISPLQIAPTLTGHFIRHTCSIAL